MRKYIVYFMVLLLISMLLGGCNSKNDNSQTKQAIRETESDIEDTVDIDDIDRILTDIVGKDKAGDRVEAKSEEDNSTDKADIEGDNLSEGNIINEDGPSEGRFVNEDGLAEKTIANEEGLSENSIKDKDISADKAIGKINNTKDKAITKDKAKTDNTEVNIVDNKPERIIVNQVLLRRSQRVINQRKK